MHRLPSDMPAGRAEHHLLLDAAVRAGLASTSKELHLRGERLANTATGAQFIAKIGGPQVYGEGLGLERMQQACPGIAPKLRVLEQLDDPTGDGRTLFISDYEELGSASGDTRNKLAERLARELHNPDNPAYKDIVRFGFDVITHCGVTPQDNTWEDDWMVFYRDRRLGFLLERIAERRPGSSTSEILALGQEVRERVCPALLGQGRMDLPPQPVLLHGDLWSGNVAQRRSRPREPVIFDGSVYYGHGEADFGISQMFNTFSSDFYDAYHRSRPRSEPHHDQRMKLYELYHHLNHYCMFGSGYAAGATRIMKSLLSWEASLRQT